MNDLSPQMQLRLDEWRKSILKVKSSEKVRGQLHGKQMSKQEHYGDDMRDYEKKEGINNE